MSRLTLCAVCSEKANQRKYGGPCTVCGMPLKIGSLFSGYAAYDGLIVYDWTLPGGLPTEVLA